MGFIRLGRPGSQNGSRVTINAVSGYLNLAKGFGLDADPNNMDSNGYPTANPGLGNQTGAMPRGYFGRFLWKWTGTASMVMLGVPMIVDSGGAAITEIAASSGDTSGNINVISQANPSIVFAFGFKIQGISNSAVSNGAGGTKIRVAVKTGFASNVATGNTINVSGILTQTNANGTWLITVIDAQTFDLDDSTWSAGQGTSGIVGEALLQNTSFSIGFGAGTYSGFTNLIVCKTADETAINSGQIVDSVLVSQLRYLLNPNGVVAPDAWLRFMDLTSVQSSYECDFSQRCPSTYLSYNASRYPSGYWANTITRSSDAYSCSDPSVSVWNGSTYIDGAVVQGTIAVTNSGVTPTLNVGGHGAKPILDRFINSTVIGFASAPASAGLTMQWTFSATWLNGGTPYVFSYLTVAGDVGDLGTFNANLKTALAADATFLAAGIQFGNSGEIAVYPRTAQAGRLTVSYTSGPAICTVRALSASTLTVGKGTFVYNYLADGWIYREGGFVQSVPFEYIVELCNRVGANCWFCWGITKGQFVTDVTDFFEDSITGLTSGLKFGTEVGNELWNASAFPYAQYLALGTRLGFELSGNAMVYNYAGLRALQYAARAKAAWTRSASQLYIIQPSQLAEVSVSSNFDSGSLQGLQLNASSNTVYATYGGLNGGTETSHNAYPNRPVDVTTAIGFAPYWNSYWMGYNSQTAASQVYGPVSENIPWLQAALDFANGSTSTAFASLVNQFTGVTVRTNPNHFGRNIPDFQALMVLEEAQAQQYDTANQRAPLGLRPLAILHYEGGPAFGLGANLDNGVNSYPFDNALQLAPDIAALAAQMSSLAWNVSAYTVSGTDDKTEMATMTLEMLQAWKYDVDRTGASAGTGSYKNMIKTHVYQYLKTINTSREAKGAQYGYAASNWGLFAVQYGQGNPYQNYEAIHEFNS